MKPTLAWTFRSIVALSFITALYLSPANAQEKPGGKPDAKLPTGRDNFTVDLKLKETVNAASVMEGRQVKYVFEITNQGPETATGISFASQLDPEPVSVNQSQGTCRFEAQNVVCNLGDLKKGETATVTYQGHCRWDFVEGRPSGAQNISATAWIDAAEMDSDPNDNLVHVVTPVKQDPNRGPVLKFVTPERETFLVGPKVKFNIVANAYDPDGTISKVEFFDENGLIGLGKLTAPKTYELPYQTETFGAHYLKAIATDNQGRPSFPDSLTFVVNGPVQIQITAPTPKTIIDPQAREFVVKLKATNPKGTIKKIIVYVNGGSALATTAQWVDKDEYIAKFGFTGCTVGSCMVWAVATDDLDVETTSRAVIFKPGPLK